MARKALIETATGKVVNVIELADRAKWQPSPGHFILDADNANPGDTWDGLKFITRQPTADEVVAQDQSKKRGEALARAVQAIKDNANALPWGKILNDMAIAQGWIEPL